MQVRSLGLESPWRRKWQPTPGFLPGNFHGQRRLVGYRPWGLKGVRHDSATKQQQHALYDPERVIQGGISQKVKNKYHISMHICGI